MQRLPFIMNTKDTSEKKTYLMGWQSESRGAKMGAKTEY
jgi:hypothetical protein